MASDGDANIAFDNLRERITLTGLCAQGSSPALTRQVNALTKNPVVAYRPLH